MELTQEMPIAEFHRMERELGWTYDYEGGQAIVRPADVVMNVRISTSARVRTRDFGKLRLCLVESHNAIALESLFVDAFRESPDFFRQDDDWIRQEAMFSLMLYLTGACGSPMTSSRVLVDGNAPVAAMLVVRDVIGPTLHLAMVHPELQRRGFGSALLAEALCDLNNQGFSHLRSRYLVANRAGRAWHRRIGFEELPDRTAIDHFRHFYHYEVSRLRGAARADRSKLEAAQAELARWNRLANSLQLE